MHRALFLCIRWFNVCFPKKEIYRTIKRNQIVLIQDFSKMALRISSYYEKNPWSMFNGLWKMSLVKCFQTFFYSAQNIMIHTYFGRHYLKFFEAGIHLLFIFENEQRNRYRVFFLGNVYNVFKKRLCFFFCAAFTSNFRSPMGNPPQNCVLIQWDC